MSSDLKSRWVRASHAIGRIGQNPFGGHISYEIQSLGRLDVWLREQDAAMEAFFNDDAAEPTGAVDNYLGLSRLWVLGGYELVRTINASVGAKLWLPTEAIAAQVQLLKMEFAQLRIPLAKFEPAFNRKAIPGDLVPGPLYVQGLGAGWDIGSDSTRVIARRELADHLLEFLEEARRQNPAFPKG